MTNAAAVIGLEFDATDIQEDPWGLFLELIRGINEPPSVRGTDTIVPGLAGRIARNRVADRWELELRGYVSGLGDTEEEQRSNFRELVEQVKVLFDPTSMPADLVATLEDGSVGTIAARTLFVAWDQVVPSMSRVSIILEAVEAWAIVPGAS